MAQLATMGAVVEVEEAEVEVEALAEIEAAAEAADVLELPPVALEAGQPPAVELAIGQRDVILPKRTSRSTLVFGNTEHIKRTRQKQQARQAKHLAAAATADISYSAADLCVQLMAKHLAAAATADMFATEPAAPQQLLLSLL